MNRLDHDAEQYVHTVLSLYQQLPETPALPSSRDRIQAYQLQQRKLPLTLIETAFLLGSFVDSCDHQTPRSCPRSIPWPTSRQSSKNYLTILFQALTSNIFDTRCNASQEKRSVGKNAIRRAFKKIRIQMIADNCWPSCSPIS